MNGNIIIGQSGGPTAAINASLGGIYKAAITSGVKNVYGMVRGIKGLLDGHFLNLSDHIKSDLDMELLKRTPSSYLGSCRYKLPKIEDEPEIYDTIFKFIDDHDIEAFFYIGGNDSMDTINKLSQVAKERHHSCRFVGCPKTVDNDLALTDHTPGYGSAAKYIATSVKEVIRDSQCLAFAKGQVTVIEIMGRGAGWLTAASALSRGEDCNGPDMIYLPEVVFDVDDFKKRVGEILKKRPYAVIAVSEGIKVADGRYVCELGDGSDFVDAFGHRQLTGTATYLANVLAAEFGCKARGVEISTLQRSASHCASDTDIKESYEAGKAAFRCAERGNTGKMITFKRLSDQPYKAVTEMHDVDKIANEERVVPREWISQDGTDVTQDMVTYIKPLILGEVSQIMVNGVPRHLVPPTELG